MRFYFLIISLLLLGACSKSKSTNDIEAPIIAITSPAPNQVFTGGQSVNITGSITDNNRVAELHIHISNNNTGALLFDIHRTPSSGTYILNETFTTQSSVNYKIQVIAKDAVANETITTLNITVN
jgi:hypothetical protein